MPFIIRQNDLGWEIVEYYIGEGIKRKIEEKNNRNYQQESSKRAKRTLIDYALNNNFNYMITITFDKEKVKDRTNEIILTKKVIKYFNNYQQRYDKDFKYILVPETHKKIEKNGKRAIHYHGLVKLTNTSHLKFIKQVDMAFIYQDTKLFKKFGANDYTKIYNSQQFIAMYITKYITKSFGKLISSRYYYTSRNLKKSAVILKTEYLMITSTPDYKDQFIRKWKVNEEMLLEILKQNSIY